MFIDLEVEDGLLFFMRIYFFLNIKEDCVKVMKDNFGVGGSYVLSLVDMV